MKKTELVAKLKKDSEANHFSLDGDYIIFDKKSNLSYQILNSFTLGELLTANPVSKTRLNLNLLASLDTIREAFGRPVTIRATYHSPEYHLLTFGQSDSALYTSGDAVAMGCESEHLQTLIDTVNELFTPGEIGLYKWGVHIGWTKAAKHWDFREDTSHKQTIKNIVTNDKMKNILLIGAAAVAGWFFFIKK